MKNVISIDSKPNFKFSGPRATQEPPERPVNEEPDGPDTEVRDWLMVVTGLGLTAWLPTTFWSLTLNDVFPLFLVGVAELFGSLIGILLYRVDTPAPLSCVPSIQIPNPKTTRSLRKAA